MSRGVAFDMRYEEGNRLPTEREIAQIARLVDAWQQSKTARGQAVDWRQRKTRELAYERYTDMLIDGLANFGPGVAPLRRLELPDGRVVTVRDHVRLPKLTSADRHKLITWLRRQGRTEDVLALTGGVEARDEMRRREHEVRRRLVQALYAEGEWLDLESLGWMEYRILVSNPAPSHATG